MFIDAGIDLLYFDTTNGFTYKKAHKIYKIDCKTLETVAVSQLLPLDHANSMCYNSKLDMLVVANCNDVITDDGLDNTKAVTFVNPDTLEIEDVVYLDFAINAIESRNRACLLSSAGCCASHAL
jgi:hypothetical protein